MLPYVWPLAGQALAVLALLVVALPAAAQAPAVSPPAASAPAPEAPAPEAAASSALKHRPLRPPLPPLYGGPPPSVPEVFTGYPSAQPYTVVPRKPELPLYPCVMCHDLQKVNLKVRQLKASVPPDGPPHAAVQKHGDGQMWCLDCHKPKPRDQLRTLNGQDVDFDDSSRLCAQCHSARHRDWAFGGHGKRVEGWTGERQIYACVHCHDPHDPRIPARAASKPPPVRAGLLPMQAVKHKSLQPWQKSKEGHPGGQEAPR